MTDKYSIMIEYLRQCPAMQGVLGFQAVNAEDGSMRIVTSGADTQDRRNYIDGSVGRRFDFTIEFYKSLSYTPYVSVTGDSTNENISDILDVQALIDWLDDEQAAGVLPNFGGSYTVDSVQSLNDQPNLAWLDLVNYDPPLAKYTITIRVEYIDFTRAI